MEEKSQYTKKTNKKTNKTLFIRLWIIITFFMALVSLGGLWSTPSIFILLIGDKFNVNLIGLSLLFVVMLLPILFSELVGFPLKQKFGQQIAALVGFYLLGIGGMLHPFMPNYILLILMRFLAALGFGLLFMNHNPILARYSSSDFHAINTLILMTGLVIGAFSSSIISMYLFEIFNHSWEITLASWGFFGFTSSISWTIFCVVEPQPSRGEID